MELTEEEKKIIDFYKNYSKNIHKETISPLEKEQIWVRIYQKLSINSSIHSVLFMSFDEATVLNELDTMVESLN